jgi:hemerythrin-like metal-binding protein
MIGDIKAITRDTIESIKSINDIMKEINGAVTTIAAAAEEQSATTESIVDNIYNTNTQIQTMTSNVREGASAIAEVSKNMIGVAELSNNISRTTKKMAESTKSTKERSVVIYAKAMEVGSLGNDVRLMVNDFKFSGKITKEEATSEPKLCKFTKKWSVSVRQFDSDHSKIFDYINEIHAMIKTGSDIGSLAKLAEEFAVFTTEHFAREEEKFKSTKYSEYDAHRVIHQKLLATVGEIVNKLKARESVNLIEALIFLKNWLFDHIYCVDKRYSSHMNKNGIN